MIRADDYDAFRSASEGGHIHILEWLKKQATAELSAMIRAENYYAFRWASKNGHLPILEWLREQASAELSAMIQAENYCAFRLASLGAHLHILKWLKEQAPAELSAMIQANDYYAFRQAFECHHSNICTWLLCHSSCLAYAESHVNEYNVQVRSFIQDRLISLHQAFEAGLASNTVFNLHEPEQALHCFYMMRALIRRNDRNDDDELRFLLSIPSVQALAHQESNEGQPNELIRLALATGNTQASEILLNVEAVRRLAEEHHFYYEERRHGIDLRQLAQDRESSMTALSRGEQKRLDAAIKQYQPLLKNAGTTTVINDLRDRLIERYEAHPACLIMEGQTLNLPLGMDELKQLNLSENQYQEALKAYYRHKDHTAWRYLSKPNPWMHPEAAYVCVSDNRQERWSSFEDYLPLIAMLWLAAIDQEMQPVDGITFDGRLEHFIDELALIGRAHNWDKERLKNGRMEEYDDGEGDRCSCFSGVKRRLFQSVIGHPLLNILTRGHIEEELRTFVRDYFISQVTEDNKGLIKQAFDEYIEMQEISKEQAVLLSRLNIPEEQQQQLKQYLAQKYGEAFTADPVLVSCVTNTLVLKSDSCNLSDRFHAFNLAGFTQFDRYLQQEPPVKALNNSLTPSFFKEKATEDDTSKEAPYLSKTADLSL
jgi:hypothetical protein